MHWNRGLGKGVVASVNLVLITLIGCSDVFGEPKGATLIVDGQHGQLFGAALGGSWLLPDDAMELMDGPILFALYNQRGLQGRCTIQVAWERGEICAQPALNTRDCVVRPDENTVMITASWNATPRLVENLDSRHAAYRKLLSEWLSDQSIDDAKPVIRQLLRVDLEGDGVNEILISATRHRGGVRSASAGDYSVVVLRKIASNTVQTIALQKDLYHEVCEGECEPQASRVIAVLDVNGDGVLEIITEAKSFESVKRTIFSVVDGSAQSRLSWNCTV